MVNWKSKYLDFKLKYINTENKLKGGSGIFGTPEDDSYIEGAPAEYNSYIEETPTSIMSRQAHY